MTHPLFSTDLTLRDAEKILGKKMTGMTVSWHILETQIENSVFMSMKSKGFPVWLSLVPHQFPKLTTGLFLQTPHCSPQGMGPGEVAL